MILEYKSHPTVSPWFLFLKENRERIKEMIKEQRIELSPVNANHIGHNIWISLSDDERESYYQRWYQSNDDYQRYEERREEVRKAVFILEARYLRTMKIKRFNLKINSLIILKRKSCLNSDLVLRVINFL